MTNEVPADVFDEYVTVRYEPCVEFDGDRLAPCRACGWLDDEHERDADVLPLARRAAEPVAVPERLVS
jgi:hypothetical protein